MKKDLRAIKTQESIRTALFSLLKSKSLESITVTELCVLARVNRGTFYLHYGNVQEVFKQSFEEIVEDLRISYEEPYRRTKDRIEQIDAKMIRIFHHVKKYQNFYEIIFNEQIPMTYYYLVFDKIRSFMSFSVGQKNNDTVDVNYLMSYQTNAIIGMLIEWHRNDYETSVEELNQQLMKILILPTFIQNKSGKN